MKLSTPQITSVLPAELEAKRLVIQKTFSLSLLLLMVPIIGTTFFLLSWVVQSQYNLFVCVAAELLFVFACSYAALKLIDKYLQNKCKKIGYTCPRCFAALFSALQRTDKRAEITGRCPSCSQLVASNINPDLLTKADAQQKTAIKRSRKVALTGAIIALLGPGLHFLTDYTNPENKAKSLIEKKQYDDAISELNQTLSNNPQNAHALTLRGIAFAKKNMYDPALSDYNQALTLNPDYTYALLNKCTTEKENGHNDAAITDCTHVIKISPTIWEAYAVRCMAYEEEMQHDQALSDCTQFIKLKPNAGPAFLTRGAIYADMFQYDLAEKDMTEAIRLMPNNGDPYAARGLVYSSAGHFDLAQQDFDKAQALSPDSPLLLISRGIWEAAQQSYAKAVDDLTRGVKVAPQESSALVWLYISKWHLGQNDQVDMKVDLNILKDEWPKSVIALYSGQAGVDAVEAQAKTGNTAAQAEQMCEAGYYIGEYYLEHNDKANAKQFLQYAINSCPATNFEEKQAAIQEFKAQNF